MRRLATGLVLAVISCSAAAEWVAVSDNDLYIAYVDPATLAREGDRALLSDLVDLKTPGLSPYGKPHASSTAQSEFDCRQPRIRTIAFALYSGSMGDGERVESVAESQYWLPVAPGTLLRILWQYACAGNADL